MTKMIEDLFAWAEAGLQRARRSHVFTVPAGTPILDTVAHAVLDGRFGRKPDGRDPLTLTDTTILLPTRRAARELQSAFLRAAPSSALLLPKIRPIGEAEDGAALMQAVARADGLAADPDLPQAVSELERRLVLATLVQRWSETLRDAPAPDHPSAERPFAAAGARTPRSGCASCSRTRAPD